MAVVVDEARSRLRMIALTTSRSGAAARRTVGEVAAHGEDLARDVAGRVGSLVGEDRLLDLVEAVVDHVGHVEVAVDDHVEDRPQEEALLGLAVLGALELEPPGHLVEIDRGAVGARGGARSASQPGPVTMSISRLFDLAARALAVVDGDVEVVAVAHQLGALARVEDGVDDRRAHAELGLERRGAASSSVGRLGVDPEDRVLRVRAPRGVGDGSTPRGRACRTT